jgi:hypothetical protein
MGPRIQIIIAAGLCSTAILAAQDPQADLTKASYRVYVVHPECG